jgi:hypothetical protein
MFDVRMTLQKMKHERASMQAEIDKLDQAIAALQSLTGSSSAVRVKPGLSANARRRISQAQKKRWAKVKQANGTARRTGPRRPRISAEGLRNIVEAQRKRWAKVRATAKGKAKAA